ncbi:MAG: TraR/DksA C4-type zinc finger protein [Alphaproteobacteria bacterium]|nr:TraR/DksA C4-type zinc finger protein [Alphaproteobacteria bacterium]
MSDYVDDAADISEAERASLLSAHNRQQWRALLRPDSPNCANCGDEIPALRRRAVPGARLCVDCQNRTEKQRKIMS